MARAGGHHRQTSSLSAMRLDAEYMQELDRVGVWVVGRVVVMQWAEWVG